ncbi:hypothetical protein E2C01_056147 [Portunus trituberculatus]|uniref:Uncharacterized protein n=1 Tax=Portunus trituberculatus TaxID=210409 RepID=A0A5B7GY57_PORTR|nr:hypothetical protein [Portunus trituberculatus]
MTRFWRCKSGEGQEPIEEQGGCPCPSSTFLPPSTRTFRFKDTWPVVKGVSDGVRRGEGRESGAELGGGVRQRTGVGVGEGDGCISAVVMTLRQRARNISQLRKASIVIENMSSLNLQKTTEVISRVLSPG